MPRRARRARARRHVGREAPQGAYQLTDKAYGDARTRHCVRVKRMKPVVLPKANRRSPWRINKGLYKQRNKIERSFKRLDAFRRAYARYGKMDLMLMAFVSFALFMIISN